MRRSFFAWERALPVCETWSACMPSNLATRAARFSRFQYIISLTTASVSNRDPAQYEVIAFWSRRRANREAGETPARTRRCNPFLFATGRKEPRRQAKPLLRPTQWEGAVNEGKEARRPAKKCINLVVKVKPQADEGRSAWGFLFFRRPWPVRPSRWPVT
jgi:hypothetical protein